MQGGNKKLEGPGTTGENGDAFLLFLSKFNSTFLLMVDHILNDSSSFRYINGTKKILLKLPCLILLSQKITICNFKKCDAGNIYNDFILNSVLCIFKFFI